MSVTVILNGYKRPYLKEQLEAINNQTVKVDETLLWYNNPGEGYEVDYEVMSQIPTALCNTNFGVWARFAFAFMAKSEYVCIFDDDTVPGTKWIENCVNTIKEYSGLLGTVGLVYPNPVPSDSPYCSYYEPYIRHGWVKPNAAVEQVDLVGHSWFFKKEWLSTYWREQPDPKYNICGEDMHFSYMLQKYLGLNTYVPIHDPNDIETWGSIKGAKYGGDSNSMWETNQPTIDGTSFKFAMNEYFVLQRRSGWKLINEK